MPLLVSVVVLLFVVCSVMRLFFEVYFLLSLLSLAFVLLQICCLSYLFFPLAACSLGSTNPTSVRVECYLFPSGSRLCWLRPALTYGCALVGCLETDRQSAFLGEADLCVLFWSRLHFFQSAFRREADPYVLFWSRLYFCQSAFRVETGPCVLSWSRLHFRQSAFRVETDPFGFFGVVSVSEWSRSPPASRCLWFLVGFHRVVLILWVLCAVYIVLSCSVPHVCLSVCFYATLAFSSECLSAVVDFCCCGGVCGVVCYAPVLGGLFSTFFLPSLLFCCIPAVYLFFPV